MSERPDVVDPLPDDEQFPDMPEDGSGEGLPDTEDEDIADEEDV
ncbi:hypothetical protein ACQK5W_07855 [Pantoea sp. FN060301]